MILDYWAYTRYLQRIIFYTLQELWLQDLLNNVRGTIKEKNTRKYINHMKTVRLFIV